MLRKRIQTEWSGGGGIYIYIIKVFEIKEVVSCSAFPALPLGNWAEMRCCFSHNNFCRFLYDVDILFFMLLKG